MPRKKKEEKSAPDIPVEELEKLAEEDPKSKRWNNANSRQNLKQYRKEPEVPEVLLGEDLDEEELDTQVDEITRGRKLSPELVRKLIPKRGVLTPSEKKRYTGIVITFLSDFKNEDPTASDIDDILEIAKCDIMETRLLEASKGDPSVQVHVSQAMDRYYKRKQTAKENLAARRTDRKDARSSQEINIVDLVVRYEKHAQKLEKERIDSLLEEEGQTSEELRKLIEEEQF